MSVLTLFRSASMRISIVHCLSALACVCFIGSASWVSAQEVTGTSTIGPRTSHIFTLRIPGDLTATPPDYGDTLPPGDGIFYQFGIFDTGSNMVVINNVSLTASDGTVVPSTTNLLDICATGNTNCVGSPPPVPILDMRIWGLGTVNPSTGGAPLDTPEAEVQGFKLRPDTVSSNLIGGPVTNNVLAYVVYTNQINHSKIWIPGADITFYETGDSGIPTPLYELQLQRFGTTTPSVIDGATRGSFYSLVDFVLTNSTAEVKTGDNLTVDTSTREARVFFDTGNTTTQITRPVAAALGIDLDNDTPDDSVEVGFADGSVETLPCFAIDSAEFPGKNGGYKYVITSPLVCVSERPSFALPQSDPHDIILGTNYFEQTQILWNGPGDTIGMFQGVVTNNPPVADAGPDQTVECSLASGTSVTLDGTGSSDPDSDPLTFAWSGVFGSASGATPTVTMPFGTHSISLTVEDGRGGTATDDVEITVDDTTPPTVDAGPDVTLQATSPDGAPYDANANVTFSDICGAVSISISPTPVNYSLGSTVVTVTATDTSGNSAQDTMTVTVEDTTPPELSITATPDRLWPPNHNLIPIGVTPTVFDIADPNPLVELFHVQSSEGDGVDTFDPMFDTTEVVGRKGGDIQLLDGQLFLRAERSGKGDGRTYEITYRATDASGNSSEATATVFVPHNQ